MKKIITRKKVDDAFKYYDLKNNIITDEETLNYILSLRIPPAYTDVYIYLNKNANPVVKAKDAAGRPQYIYSQSWIKIKTHSKYCTLIKFIDIYPKIQRDLYKYANGKRITKNKLIAIILLLIADCKFRIGNNKYNHLYNTYGVTTLLEEHIKQTNKDTVISFVGKKSVHNTCTLKDEILKKELNGLLKNHRGPKTPIFSMKCGKSMCNIISNDVNNFLKIYDASITSKTFRTFFANIGLIDALKLKDIPDKITKRKKQYNECIKEIATSLNNTTAVTKKSYITKHIENLYFNKPASFLRKFKASGDTVKQFRHFLTKFCK